MPQCSTKPAASSYSIVFASSSFIPLALVSSLLVIISIIKDPFKELRTQLHIFVFSSAIASLISVPVNGLRVWFHSVNATGTSPYKAYPSVVPALHTCHVFWFTAQFAATASLFAVLLLKICDKQPSSLPISGVFLQKTSSLVALFWMVGFGFGLGSVWTGMPLMTKIQTTTNNAFAVLNFVLTYFCIIRPGKRSVEEQPRTLKGCTTVMKFEEVKEENSTKQTIYSESRFDTTETDKAEQATVYQYEVDSTFAWHVLIYFFCAVSSGILLLILQYADSISCPSMFWLNDIRTLCMQCYLAVSNIVTLVTMPKLRKAVICLVKPYRAEVHP